MTEHLPECPWFPNTYEDVSCKDSETLVSFCDALRACEERVREDERSNNFTPDDHADSMTEAYQRGLDAAREAVKGVNWFNDEGKMLSAVVAQVESLSAIDALKEKR